jgi:hypothetical protein
MAKVKLFGLVLIITTSVLALAAMSTQTNQIRIRSFNNEADALQTGSYPGNSHSTHANPASHRESELPGNNFPRYQPNGVYEANPESINQAQPLSQPGYDQQPPSNAVQFVSIPIVVPLCVAGLLGIILWLTPLKSKPKKFYGRRSSARRRK